jgi:hypothetical protein
VDESDSGGPSSPSRSHTDEVNLGNTEAASHLPETVINENDPSPEARTNELARPQVKHMAKRRKFGPRDRLAGIISEAELMWGRPVIRPFDTEEVRQESAFSDNGSDADDDEEAANPQNQTYAEDMEEHTPRTPSAEQMDTPPPLETKCEVEHGTSPRANPAKDQTEAVERKTPKGVGV